MSLPGEPTSRVLLYLLAGSADESIAAVLVVEPNRGPGWCWYNREFIRGRALGLLELWALRAVRDGRRFAVLTPDDLKGILG